MPPELIDIGLNLGHASFRADRDAVLARAAAAGVRAMVVTGTSVRDSHEPLALARPAGHALRHRWRPSAPRRVRREHHRRAARAGRPAGGGRDRRVRPRLQPRLLAARRCRRRWFEAQLELAAELHLPVFLHERDAARPHVAILAQAPGEARRRRRPLLHRHDRRPRAPTSHSTCTSASPAGSATSGAASTCVELVRTIPLDRLMIETDAPFLTPRDLRPRPTTGATSRRFCPTSWHCRPRPRQARRRRRRRDHRHRPCLFPGCRPD